jgi:hypothetical protein
MFGVVYCRVSPAMFADPLSLYTCLDRSLINKCTSPSAIDDYRSSNTLIQKPREIHLNLNFIRIFQTIKHDRYL